MQTTTGVWTQELAAVAYKTWRAGAGEEWYDPQFNMRRKGDPKYYVTEDGTAQLGGSTSPTGPSATTVAIVTENPTQPSRPNPSDNPRPDAIEKHWNVPRDGYFDMHPHDMYEAVTPNDRALDLCLRWNAGQNLICWPSRESISTQSGLTISQIRTSEGHLCEGNLWLAMEEWKSTLGDRAPYCYILFPLCRYYTIEDLSVRIPYGGWHVPKEPEMASQTPHANDRAV